MPILQYVQEMYFLTLGVNNTRCTKHRLCNVKYTAIHYKTTHDKLLHTMQDIAPINVNSDVITQLLMSSTVNDENLNL
jgi:hypothetical protein